MLTNLTSVCDPYGMTSHVMSAVPGYFRAWNKKSHAKDAKVFTQNTQKSAHCGEKLSSTSPPKRLIIKSTKAAENGLSGIKARSIFLLFQFQSKIENRKSIIRGRTVKALFYRNVNPFLNCYQTVVSAVSIRCPNCSEQHPCVAVCPG